MKFRVVFHAQYGSTKPVYFVDAVDEAEAVRKAIAKRTVEFNFMGSTPELDSVTPA